MSTPAAEPKVFSVAQITDALARVVNEHTRTVWVSGEVTNLSRGGAGRLLFLRLRDPGGQAQVDATVLTWETPVAFDIADGMTVRVRAKPEFFPRHGALRLHVYEIAPEGEGALLARIEALRRSLAAEGLMAPERKKQLPFLPARVGLITARDGAARRDVETTLTARAPSVSLLVMATLMQGQGSPGEVVRALYRLDSDPTIDVIVLARGGGSLEDLMAFNDERVARAIAACETPVVAAIGHERDTTIACDVADVRAITPTEAATLVVPDSRALLDGLSNSGLRGRAGLRRLVSRAEADLVAMRARPCLARPEALVESATVRHTELRRRLRAGLLGSRDRAAGQLATTTALLPRALQTVVARSSVSVGAGRERLASAGAAAVERAERTLELVSERLSGRDPTRPLRAGFALVTGPDGHVVTSAQVALQAEKVRLRFADGTVDARIKNPNEETS